MTPHGNLFADIPFADNRPDPAAERFDALFERPGVKVERIVSTGQASPPGFWYDQPGGEWVMVMRGAAGLRFEDETEPRPLGPGDWVWIAPHRRHRVEWTAPDEPTIWLALHVDWVSPA